MLVRSLSLALSRLDRVEDHSSTTASSWVLGCVTKPAVRVLPGLAQSSPWAFESVPPGLQGPLHLLVGCAHTISLRTAVWPSPTPAMRRRSACWPLGSRASRAGAMRRIRSGYEIFFVFQPYLEVSCATCGDTHERMYPVVSHCIPVYPRGARVGPCVRVWIRVS